MFACQLKGKKSNKWYIYMCKYIYMYTIHSLFYLLLWNHFKLTKELHVKYETLYILDPDLYLLIKILVHSFTLSLSLFDNWLQISCLFAFKCISKYFLQNKEIHNTCFLTMHIYNYYPPKATGLYIKLNMWTYYFNCKASLLRNACLFSTWCSLK